SPPFYSFYRYVYLSYCTNPRHVKVVFPKEQNDTKTVNVVYTKVLGGFID
ncbi:hypothetical protein PAXRUDRAFT_163576, partial [Paxillus rubicundulus Ve08.2h10]